MIRGSGGEPATDAAFQEALVGLLADAAQQDRFRQRVLAQSFERFGWDAIARDWERDLLS